VPDDQDNTPPDELTAETLARFAASIVRNGQTARHMAHPQDSDPTFAIHMPLSMWNQIQEAARLAAERGERIRELEEELTKARDSTLCLSCLVEEAPPRGRR
jgi:hypothetical protein